MIIGPWGIGKTFLIKSFLKGIENESHVKQIYISLYGKIQLDQIDEEIFQKLHPFLGSKGVKLLGVVAKGILKTTTNINLGSSETISINVQLPDINSAAVSNAE